MRAFRPVRDSLTTPKCSQVEDPLGRTMFEKKASADGQFSFTTKEDGDYKACFTTRGQWATRLVGSVKFLTDWALVAWE